jgi:hypothetical protein
MENPGLLTKILSACLLFLVIIIPLKRACAAIGGIPYSFFLEHPYSVTDISGNLELAPVDGGGALIMNSLRADLNL